MTLFVKSFWSLDLRSVLVFSVSYMQFDMTKFSINVNLVLVQSLQKYFQSALFKKVFSMNPTNIIMRAYGVSVLKRL